MKKRVLLLSAVSVVALLSACTQTSSSSSSQAGPASSSSSQAGLLDGVNGDGTTLKLSVKYQSSKSQMRFDADLLKDGGTYTGANGKTYRAGDFKPVWEQIQKDLNFTIEDVTDKGYYTNSYHIDVREDIDAFSKFEFESQFQKISTGGCISYVEIPNMRHNLEALKSVVRFIYDNIQYAEFNTKSDYCQCCGYDGEIQINEDFQWECPSCGNKDQSKMNVTRRTCGYLGENFWNVGKTKEIKSRVMHL